MTPTSRPVTRVSTDEYHVNGRRTRIVITIDHDVLTVRPLGSRKRYRMTAASLFVHAAEIAARRIDQRTRQLRKQGWTRKAARREAEREILS